MPNIKTQGMQMPVASPSAAAQVEATNNIALQQQMKSAGASTPVTSGDIQNLGTQSAQQQVAVNQGQQQAALGDTINAAQRDFQSQQNAAAQQGLMDDQARAQARLDMEAQLSSLGRDVKNTLLDRELKLDANTNQLKFTNERQLADLAIKLSSDRRDLDERLLSMQQASDASVQAAQFEVEAYAQAQKFIMKDRQLQADIELQKKIADEKRAAEKREEAARKKAGVIKKVIGVGKMAAGAYIATIEPTTGAAVATSGASDVAT